MTLRLISLFFVGALSFGFTDGALANSYPNAITPAEAKSKLDRGQAVLIDVREKSEVDLGMAEPAMWYPKSSIDADLTKFTAFLATYPGKEIILYCRSGKRASVIIEALAKKNLTALNMGGFSEWIAAGYPAKRP